jgi:hypothetical protein
MPFAPGGATSSLSRKEHGIMIADRSWFPQAQPEQERLTRTRPVVPDDTVADPVTPDGVLPATPPTAEESLVADARADQTPAQMVEHKLASLLRGGVVPLSHLQRLRAGTCRGR